MSTTGRGGRRGGSGLARGCHTAVGRIGDDNVDIFDGSNRDNIDDGGVRYRDNIRRTGYVGIPTGSTYFRIRGGGGGGRGGSNSRIMIGCRGKGRSYGDELEFENDMCDELAGDDMLDDDAMNDDIMENDTHDEFQQLSPTTQGQVVLPDAATTDAASNELKPGELWFSSPEVVRALSKVIKGSYHKAWLNWSETDQKTKKHWFHRFKKIYKWKPDIEQEVWVAFNKKAATRLKDLVNKAGKMRGKKPYFMSDDVHAEFIRKRAQPDFIERSRKALKNRLSGTDDTHIDPGHRQGSISTIELTKRMAKEKNGNLPTAAEVYIRSHSKKVDGNQRVLMENKKVKDVMEMYNNKVEELAQEGVEKTPNEIFYEVVGGHKKGTVPGLGDGAEIFYGKHIRSYQSSCTPSLISQIYHYRDEATEAKQKVEAQEIKIQDQENKIKEQANEIQEQGKKIEDVEKRLEEYQSILASLVSERRGPSS